MKQQHKELIAQPWASQMVINAKRTTSVGQDRLTATLRSNTLRRIVDFCQCWTQTPQRGEYWVNIHNVWVENHR
jgi:hypothetical protein